MSAKSALIVGSGLGGLLCGLILSRKGWEVTVLEADTQPGGVLAGFEWEGVNCETGFHSVGGLAPGEPLEKLFRPLGLMDLPWYKADQDEGFAFLRLNSRTEYEIEHIIGPYQKSVWRLKGGGNTLMEELSKGLDIRLQKKVQAIENKVITCEDGESFNADIIISDLHPLTTIQMVRDHLRPSYVHRLSKLENGPDIFTVHCLLEDAPWQSGAIFLDEEIMLHFGEPETGVLEIMRFGEGNPVEMIERAAQRLGRLKVKKYRSMLSQGYGIIKHSNADFVSPVTPLPWLFLTGQNLGLHGILGTTISALNTCKSIELSSPEGR